MLQQIIKDMYIEPELLAELDEEQKQLLFCKMREEQVRKWELNELELEKDKDVEKKLKKGGKKVSFKVGLDGEPIVAVIGSHPDDVDIMLEEKANHQAELEDGALRLAAEEELDKLVNQSHSTVQKMESDSTLQERDPTREAVVQSLQGAKQELEDKMRSETVNVPKPDSLNTQDKNPKNETIQPVDATKINVSAPKSHKNGEKTLVSVSPYSSKGNSQTANNNVPFLNSKNTCSHAEPELKTNREKLKEVSVAPENNTKSVSDVSVAPETNTQSTPLYLSSDISANPSTSSLFTIRSINSNPIIDFPIRKKTADEGVAAHVQQYERLSASSLAALKTATLERAKKRRAKEILDYLRLQVDLAKNSEPEDLAWREQERKAKNAEKRIREIARRARAEHRRVSIGSDDSVPANDTRKKAGSPDKNPRIEDINGNMNVDLENARNINLRHTEENKGLSGRNSDIKTDTLTKPLSKEAIVEWFKSQELPKGSGLDSKRQNVAKWFHGLISRSEAEEILLKGEIGSFLVRVSERIWGYVVSYRSSKKCRHCLIDITDGNYAFLGSYKNTHSSLYELVEYHRTNAITTSEDDCELLINPCCHNTPNKVYEELFSATPYKCIQD